MDFTRKKPQDFTRKKRDKKTAETNYFLKKIEKKWKFIGFLSVILFFSYDINKSEVIFKNIEKMHFHFFYIGTTY